MNDNKVKFAQAVFEGKTNTQAAIDAGYVATSAYQTGARLAKDKEVIELINNLRHQARRNAEDPAAAFSTVDSTKNMSIGSGSGDSAVKNNQNSALTGDYIPNDHPAFGADRSRNRGHCNEIPEIDSEDMIIIQPCNGDPKLFLERLMENNLVDIKTRADAAKSLMPYCYKKLGEVGKKEDKETKAKDALGRGFSPGKPPVMKVVEN